ncbi:DNA independent RNA polymerase I transcription factor [Tieghemiomyces parasiticus]|uniref:DNA independent RNA polymerase I transcription factor n=1 Tax=Tieghemiomyces parasiticus TaxID=78921 RepID=A0A9W8AEQ1_9FUNG|nr:DNA independent RNA polymerase I transcription factor [Tieghemiomyces parasiticus]
MTDLPVTPTQLPRQSSFLGTRPSTGGPKPRVRIMLGDTVVNTDEDPAGGLVRPLDSDPESDDDDDNDGEATLDTTAMMASYLSNALEEHKLGNTKAYLEIITEINGSGISESAEKTSLGSQLSQSFASADNSASATTADAASAQDKPTGMDPRQLVAWVLTFTRMLHRMDRQCAELVGAILDMSWINRQPSVVTIYTRFLCNLVSAQPYYAGEVMRVLVGFLAARTYVPLTEPGVDPNLTKNVVFDRAHRALRSVLNIIPTAHTALSPLLARFFPLKFDSAERHQDYLYNILRIADYAPALRQQILGLVVDRMIQIDVEIQVEVEELEENREDEDEDMDEDKADGKAADGGEAKDGNEAETTVPTGIFEMEDEGDDEAVALDLTHAEDVVQDDSAAPLDVRRLVDKLDGIFFQLFSYLERFDVRYDPPAADTSLEATAARESAQATRQELFFILLDLFDRVMLTTFKSRYTQFLLFYVCSLDPAFPDMFLGTLIAKLCEATPQGGAAAGGHRAAGSALSSGPANRSSDVVRVAVAAYVSSFLARAHYVNPLMIRTAASLLIQWARAYLEQYEKINLILATRLTGGASPGMPPHMLRSTSSTVPPTPALSRTGSSSSLPRTASASQIHGAATAASATLQPERHTVFYAVAQALMYMFCFRWRELQLGTEEAQASGGVAGTWCPEIRDLPRVVMCSLLPLRMCSEAVTKQFTRMSKQLNFMYCYSVLQAPSQFDAVTAASGDEQGGDVAMVGVDGSGPSASPESNGSPSLSPEQKAAADLAESEAAHKQQMAKTYADLVRQPSTLQAELATFFPFDPFHLPLSGPYISQIYDEWDSRGLGGEGDDSESDYDSEDDDSDDYGSLL